MLIRARDLEWTVEDLFRFQAGLVTGTRQRHQRLQDRRLARIIRTDQHGDRPERYRQRLDRLEPGDFQALDHTVTLTRRRRLVQSPQGAAMWPSRRRLPRPVGQSRQLAEEPATS